MPDDENAAFRLSGSCLVMRLSAVNPPAEAPITTILRFATKLSSYVATRWQRQRCYYSTKQKIPKAAREVLLRSKMNLVVAMLIAPKDGQRVND
jgi:hypothetical protein